MKKVWINGTFDILHIGHIELFKYASTFGIIKVGIDSDARVKILKDSSRPFNNQDNRKTFLLSLKYINEVVIFNTDKELEVSIQAYNPDYLIIGDDYKDKHVIGGEYAKEIIFYKKIPNISTTKILSYGI